MLSGRFTLLVCWLSGSIWVENFFVLQDVQATLCNNADNNTEGVRNSNFKYFNCLKNKLNGITLKDWQIKSSHEHSNRSEDTNERGSDLREVQQKAKRSHSYTSQNILWWSTADIHILIYMHEAVIQSKTTLYRKRPSRAVTWMDLQLQHSLKALKISHKKTAKKLVCFHAE